MEQEGTVSIWVGHASSKDTWRTAITIDSYDDENWGSPFTRAFGIDDYDEDFQEAHFHPRSHNQLGLLLRGASYDDQVIEQAEKLNYRVDADTNCVMLLYNFNYQGSKHEWKNDGVSLRFVGTVTYDHR